MSPAPRPPAAESAEVANRARVAVEALYKSHAAAGRAWGKPQSTVYRQVNRSELPSSWVFEKLAAAGVDVTTLLTGVPRPTPSAAVPLFETLLPGPPGEFAKWASGAYAAPPEFAATAGLYAARINETLAAATLGGEDADRPRPGDVLIVAADPAVAMLFAATTAGAETPVLKTIPPTPRRPLLLLPPPIVLVDGNPVLSLAHRVTLFDDGEPPGKHTLRLLAEPRGPAAQGAAASDPIGRRLEAVGFALWRGGPLWPR